MDRDKRYDEISFNCFRIYNYGEMVGVGREKGDIFIFGV